MPFIPFHTVLEISPDKYLRNCGDTELVELYLLISSPAYANRIDAILNPKETPAEQVPDTGKMITHKHGITIFAGGRTKQTKSIAELLNLLPRTDLIITPLQLDQTSDIYANQVPKP